VPLCEVGVPNWSQAALGDRFPARGASFELIIRLLATAVE
jgi:hypothetical protein